MAQKSVKNAIISTMSRDIKKFQNLAPPFFSRDSDLRNSSRDEDMLQRDVDMYEHIHISIQHIHKK